jgi:hypothetical protein
VPLTAPDPDEYEVTVFGRGVGECIVLHFDGDWLIVDSYLEQRRPVAERYLDELSVGTDAVQVVVVTHFHADHYRGIDRLHDRYGRARLMITEALKSDEFVGLYSDEDQVPLLDVLPATMRRAKSRVIGSGVPGLRELKVGAPVHQTATTRVTALSPSEAAVIASRHALALAIETGDRYVVSKQLKDDNRCAVVLHVSFPGFAALLGADLVNDTAGLGWTALLLEPLNAALDPADIVKVPHHGSAGADHGDMWNRLVADRSSLVVTPYWPSGIPTDEDLARLVGHGRVWQAAPSSRVDEDEFGNRVSVRPETGFVRARRRVGEDEWRIEVSGVAREVTV